jgi:hypothetical protein
MIASLLTSLDALDLTASATSALFSSFEAFFFLVRLGRISLPRPHHLSSYHQPNAYILSLKTKNVQQWLSVRAL